MKIFFLQCVFIFFGVISNAQVTLHFSLPQGTELIADAGKDTIVSAGDQVKLGGDVTASGGSGTYTYLWAPSIGLSNPTVANPMATVDTNITYTLTVDDGFCSRTATVALRVENITGLESFASTVGLKLFPNPNQGSFLITSERDLGEKFVLLQIFNSLGQLVYSKNLDGLSKINESVVLSKGDKGMFIIMVSTFNNKAFYRITVQ